MYGKGNIVKWNYSSYRNPTNTTTSAQISTYAITAEDYSAAYTYQYDDNGNILSVSDGTNTTSYVYDSENQLLRENNQAANKTWTWEYDNAGNILSRKEYAYTTGSLENITPTATFAYTYGDESWGDLLTGYAGQTITSDAIGNMLSDGTRTYTWQHGRDLASMSSGSVTWNFTYNADDLRTRRTNGTTTYDYTYNGSTLTHMRVGSDVLHFVYDASGRPMAVTYNGTNYYYVTNLQGDVIAILDTEGTAVVTYTYDAWGKILTTGGEMADTLGAVNPLRYRGYVYDQETQLYYLQSRYYDPNIGRFINADVYAATGQGILGNNMFAYCNNNPVIYCDDAGNLPVAVVNTLAKMVLAGLANGIIGFSIEYFSGSGTFSSSVKEFGRSFASGFISGIPKIGDTLSVIYDVNEVIKSCNKAGITGRDRLRAIGATILSSQAPDVDYMKINMSYELALSYLMGDSFAGFVPSLTNTMYLNEIYSDQAQCTPQQIRCTTSVMSNVPAGGGMFNGVKTVNCFY